MVRSLLVALAALVAAACGNAPPGTGDDAAADARPPPPDAAGADAEGAAFVVQYADPDHGPFRGLTETTIRGNGFAESDRVWIGGRQVLEQEYIDSRRFRVVTPVGEPGIAAIEIRKGTGEIAVDEDAFTYDAVAMDPASGSTAGNTFVTVTGLGTSFDATTSATLDGVPLTGLQVVDAQRVTGFTPPGTLGDADLIVRTDSEVHEVSRAFSYHTTGDFSAGGMSGGPIAGAVNVVVLDSWTKNGIPGAYVALGDPLTTAHQGYTDALGQITFSAAGLVGPVDVVATAADHEVASFSCFDAANLTIFLRSPTPPPSTGPPGTGPVDGTILGHVTFGNATGQGSPFWSLVPQPRTPSEVKRIYVTTSAPTIFSSPRAPLAPIDYAYDPDVLAWEFEVRSRPGAYAIVAVAGLYDPARDPDGNGVAGFEPFALGVTRGVLVGPAEIVTNVDVIVDIPLDAAAHVELLDPPPLGTPGWDGPLEYTLKSWVDLGGDGAIAFGRHGLPIVANEPPPGTTSFPPGDTDVLVSDAPPRFSTLGGASYTFQAGAYTTGSNPFSVRFVRGLSALGAVDIGGFLGVPRPVDPPFDGTATSRRVEFAPEGNDEAPTFHMHLLSTETGDPVWRGITCGGRYQLDLPDLTPAGVSWPPAGQRLVWTVWSIDAVGDDFNQFTYRWLGATYWSGYAADAGYATWPVEAPPP